MADEKILKILLMFNLDPCYKFFCCDIKLFGLQHGGRPMRIVSADINALVSHQSLKSYPDIGLNMFHQMAKMDGTIGIWEGAGN